MDHFCPWVVNTVGFYNRKFFVLFLFYTLLACSWVILTAAPILLHMKNHPGAPRALERQIGPNKFMMCTMAAVLDCALIVMLSCFMPFHVRMAMLNETTIEGPSPEFHVGLKRNWRQVMGKDHRLWLVPLYGGGPDGDGIHWPSPLVTWAGEGGEDGYGGTEGTDEEEGRRAGDIEMCAGGTSHTKCGAGVGCGGGGPRSSAHREEGRLLGSRDCGNSSSDGD